MESYIPISFLNDFIFCPRSIYFHQIYGSFHEGLYQQKVQIDGKAAHKTIDGKTYSTRKKILQGVEVYSETYGLFGKIDLFEIESGKLRERKREIKTIYDGYVFQLYAQCFGLRELGYTVNSMALYDLVHNKEYPVELPEKDQCMMEKFKILLQKIKCYSLIQSEFVPLEAKCKRCIYSNLCDVSLC